VLVIFGGILFIILHPAESFDYNFFKGEPARLKHIHTVLKETLELKSRAVIITFIVLTILALSKFKL
jgi:hypothetical protein